MYGLTVLYILGWLSYIDYGVGSDLGVGSLICRKWGVV